MAAIWLVALTIGAAPTATDGTVGIFNIEVAGLSADYQKTAIDALATAVSGVSSYHVISRAELDAILGAEKLKDALGCDDVSCLSEIGLAAGAERIIAGSVSKLESNIVVSLQLVNVVNATVESRATVDWPGPVSELSELLATAAELLVLPAPPPGSMRVAGVGVAAVVTVDGTPRGSGPIHVDALEVGVHTLMIDEDDFEAYQAPFLVRSGKTRVVEVQLTPKPEQPLYAKWWFWTSIAAVVAGGVTTAVLLSGNDASGTFTVDTPEAFR